MRRKQMGGVVRIATVTVALALLAGCGATKLDDLQDEYRTAYIGLAAAEARARSGQAAAGNLKQADTKRSFQLVLADVAREAVKEGDGARDARTAIGFYLVAALSAWQAGAEGQQILLDIADKGTAKCGALKGSPTRPPRDCAQLVVVPALAINDQLFEAIAGLQKRIKEPGASAAALKPEAQRLKDATRENFLRLQRHGETVSGSAGISPSYVSYYENQQLVLYCNHFAVASLLADPPFSDQTGRKPAAELRSQLPASVRSVPCQTRPGGP